MSRTQTRTRRCKSRVRAPGCIPLPLILFLNRLVSHLTCSTATPTATTITSTRPTTEMAAAAGAGTRDTTRGEGGRKIGRAPNDGLSLRWQPLWALHPRIRNEHCHRRQRQSHHLHHRRHTALVLRQSPLSRFNSMDTRSASMSSGPTTPATPVTLKRSHTPYSCSHSVANACS